MNNQAHSTPPDDLAETRHHVKDARPRKTPGAIARLTAVLRPAYDGPPAWLWYTGVSRIVMLVVVAMGAQQVVQHLPGIAFLTLVFLGAFASNMWYLYSLWRTHAVPPSLTWTQMFVDFSVVAVTVSFTGGSSSYFTFLFIIVILEAGALMGLAQGFVFASLSALFLFFQDLPAAAPPVTLLPYWYNFLIQCISLFSAAVISGYWNQRVSRLKQFQREILDNMVSGFLICDTQGVIIAANEAARSILEKPEHAMVGHGVAEVLICESGAECPVITALRNQRDYISYEFAARVENGAARVLGLTTNRLYDPYSRLIAVIVSFTDLTEIAQMRQALQRQDRLAAVGESAAELAHEIRNPLTSLRSAVDELQRHGRSPEMAARLCGIAMRESEHLNRIVTGFLEFARNPEFKREEIDLELLLRELTSTLLQTTPETDVQMHAPPAPTVISGDPTQIRQLCDNILRNSVEAMSGTGHIDISLRHAGNYVEIRIDDTGPGIAPDCMTRVFEPFYTDKPKGVGMGLAVCQRIVTAHDGDIQPATRPGGGASMVVRLPLVRKE